MDASFIHRSRPSRSPLAQHIWEVVCLGPGDFLMCADTAWDLVIARTPNGIQVYMDGPSNKAVRLQYTPGTQLLGIRFVPGTMFHDVRLSSITNSAFLLAQPAGNMFWLSGYAYEFPTFDTAEDLIDKLYRNGLLFSEKVVQTILQKDEIITSRTLQRHFLRATGLAQMDIRQIQRAWQAMRMLQDGQKTAAVAVDLGYTDQAHMTKFLKKLLGETPKHIDQIIHS